MEKTIEQIYVDALKEITTASDPESIKALSIRYIGRKGIVTQFLRNISKLFNYEPEYENMFRFKGKTREDFF